MRTLLVIILLFSFCYTKDWKCYEGLCPPGTICINCQFNDTIWAYCFALTCSCTSYDNCTLNPMKIIVIK